MNAKPKREFFTSWRRVEAARFLFVYPGLEITRVTDMEASISWATSLLKEDKESWQHRPGVRVIADRICDRGLIDSAEKHGLGALFISDAISARC